ncbi:MAG: PQQ-binding-like beta-propeller repeat protein [Gemmataceae bacterium]|nr:PQQ-binding-like beta-propeller repeat protein [Gemmataceae bacterium]
MARYLTVAVIALLVASPLSAENWPAWRGPRGDGTSTETGLPIHWSATENIAWKVPLPGKGHSSPIVWEDRIFVTTCVEDQGQRQLVCLDRRTGRMRWQQTVLEAPLEGKHRLNSYASSTPATDGQRVFVTFLQAPNVQVACYDFDGRRLWMKSPGKFFSKHGFCSSPILYKDLVIVNCDQDAEAYIVALEKSTGTERWRIDRPNRTRSYCPPLIVEAAGKTQMVLSGSLCVASYDPDTGRQHWIIDGPTEQFVASLVYAHDVLFLTYGFPKLGIMGIRPDGQGNVTQTHVLYNDPRGGGYVPSPVAAGNWFFNVTDKGIASCREARTGKLVWLERLGKSHSASPVAAQGLLYFPDDQGNVWVVKASDRFEVVAKNPLGDECYASPAVSQGRLYFRTLHSLWCVGPAESQ